MKKKHLLFLLTITLMILLCACGNSKKDADTSDATTETFAQEASQSDADSERTVTVGHFEDSLGNQDADEYTVYVNDSFGFKLVLESSKWSFLDAEKMANYCEMTKQEITNIQNGKKSPYDVAVSYIVMAVNDGGENVTISYFCPKQKEIEGYISSKDYIEMVSQNYANSKTGKKNLGGIEFDILELSKNDGSSQVMYAAEKDGIIVMIVITANDINECESMIQSN